jgi:lysine 2,3-aminomutase
MNTEEIYYQPRDYKKIELWKNVSEKDWNDPLWQQKNSIKTVEQLSKVITLTEYQKKEIERTVSTLYPKERTAQNYTYYAHLCRKIPFFL